MKNQLLHIFRNTPFGRETFLQSIYFCKMTGLHLKVFIPRHLQFLMYFSREVVTVDLDKSFLRSPETAKQHAEDLIRETGVDASFLEPKRFTASTLPDIPVDFGFMTCPRTISDLSSKVGLGYIGPRVRAIIKNAAFPVLIPTAVYKEWKHIVVLFGGSANALNAFRLGVKLQLLSGLPLNLFTYAENKPKSYYEKILEEHDLFSGIQSGGVEWQFVEKGHFREGLYEVSHDALVIAGAYGHGLIKEILFGNMMEEIQTILPNNLVIVGPHYSED
ncbi:MAG: universal stress protein [Thermoplasmata archaeon]|nr:MAG: universal stress protein UspA [Desulfobacteraceae bacterium 4484_190.3]RLB18752.1 MAG: universal stress protein [Deltaproteobacteria bacterium]RLF57602.1 MAG: universal stress protein [Thermoplasmata archaeon]